MIQHLSLKCMAVKNFSFIIPILKIEKWQYFVMMQNLPSVL